MGIGKKKMIKIFCCILLWIFINELPDISQVSYFDSIKINKNLHVLRSFITRMLVASKMNGNKENVKVTRMLKSFGEIHKVRTQEREVEEER